jgi:hypothetical protein
MPRGSLAAGESVPAKLTKPRTSLYRSFLYLNGDEVINSLSALEGGDVDEVLIRQGSEGGGELGAELGVGPAKAKGGRKRSHKFEEEMRRKRTQHSATAVLLKRLHDEDAIGVIEGDYGEDVYSDLEENLLLEFRAEIRQHPLHQVISAGRSFAKAAPTFGIGRNEIREIEQVVGLLETLAQPGAGGRAFLIFAETPGTRDGHKVVMPIQERHLLVGLDDFAGTATFVAQVDRIIPEGEQVLAIRLLRNAPPLAFERQGLEEALPDLLDGFQDLGIDVSESDFFLTRPTVIMKPICIYK